MSEKKKRRPRREFNASFKTDAVKLAQTGERPLSLIAKELDITETSLRAWVRQSEIDAQSLQSGPLTSAEREELQALRARVKKLETQQIILKKAAAFFAQDGKLGSLTSMRRRPDSQCESFARPSTSRRAAIMHGPSDVTVRTATGGASSQSVARLRHEKREASEGCLGEDRGRG